MKLSWNIELLNYAKFKIYFDFFESSLKEMYIHMDHMDINDLKQSKMFAICIWN